MSEANRLEAAIDSAEWADVDLAAVIENCAGAYRGVYPGREISFKQKGKPRLVNCAPDLIAQALDKLVENAISLTADNDLVQISLEFEPGECLVSVRNSGSELPDLLPEQLFDSLVTMREKSGGRHLGLGLHVVRLVAEAHGGAVSASNLNDKAGVEFLISFPIGSG
jgi:K+-sensing histidine kinase KdpD